MFYYENVSAISFNFQVYEALNKLIKSGIPGLEGLFSPDGAGNLFSKMSDEDKNIGFLTQRSFFY